MGVREAASSLGLSERHTWRVPAAAIADPVTSNPLLLRGTRTFTWTLTDLTPAPPGSYVVTVPG